MSSMTIILKDEAVSSSIQAEAARRHTTPDELVTEALREWLEGQDDAELLPLIEEARSEWREKGGLDAHEFPRRAK